MILKTLENIQIILQLSRTDNEGIWWYLRDNFSYFSIKTYFVGTHEYPHHMFGELMQIILQLSSSATDGVLFCNKYMWTKHISHLRQHNSHSNKDSL